MKKALIYISVLMIALALYGCARKSLDEKTDPASTGQSESPIVSSGEIDKALTSKNSDLSLGRWVGNTFVSEWAGFSIPLPSGWYRATDDEIQTVYNTGIELVAGTGELEVEDLEKASYIYPMMILKKPLGTIMDEINSNLVVFYEKLIPLNNLIINARTYLDLTKEQYENLGLGYKVSDEYAEIKIAGEKYFAMSADNLELGLRQIFICRKNESFIIGIVITGNINDSAEIEMLIDSIEIY